MNREQILILMTQCGLIPVDKLQWSINQFVHEDSYIEGDDAAILQFADELIAREREACAAVCDAAHERFKELWNRFDYPEDEGRMDASIQCAAAIRARSNTNS